jgi:hypothetical protein
LVARRLAAAGYDPDVTNFGQQGWVSMQGFVTLLLELRQGNVPDIVVFWDGENDVPSAYRNGVAGLAYDEPQRRADYARNTAARRRDGAVDAKLAVRSLMMHSALLHRLLRLVDRGFPPQPVPEPAALCHAITSDWLREAHLIERLAVQYHFTPIMVWQPTWYTSDRPRSRFEREVAGVVDPLMGEKEQGPHRRECARQVDSLIAAGASGSLVNLARLHADDTSTVFFDLFGHTTERATAREADTLVALLLPRLRADRAEAGVSGRRRDARQPGAVQAGR